MAADFLAFAFGDFVPYQDEYSNEFLNSWSTPQSLHLPLLTAPFGGSITQWCVQPPSALSVLAADFSEADVGLLIECSHFGIVGKIEAAELNVSVAAQPLNFTSKLPTSLWDVVCNSGHFWPVMPSAANNLPIK